MSAVHAVSVSQIETWIRASPQWKQINLQYESSETTWKSLTGSSIGHVTVGSALGYSSMGGNSNTSSNWSVSASTSVLPWSSASLEMQKGYFVFLKAQVNRIASQNATIVDIYSQWCTWAETERQLKLAQERLAWAKVQLEIARAQVQQGTLSSDGLKTKAYEQVRMQADVDTALDHVEQARAGVSSALGLPNVGSESDFVLPQLVVPEMTLSEAVQTAWSHRSEVFSAQYELESARIDAAAARRNAWPTVALSGQFGNIGSQGGTLISTGLNINTGLLSLQASGPFQSASSSPNGLSATLSMNIPLFDPSTAAAVESADLKVRQLELALEMAKMTVQMDVQKSRTTVIRAYSAVRTAELSLELSQSITSTKEAQFAAGIGTVLDVQEAQLNTTSSEVTLETARSNVWLAELSLKQSLGLSLDTEVLGKVEQ
ncbi:MAG: TolC family protein [Deinococcaceae bacterium]